MLCDAYIIGSGFAGSIIARYLAEKENKKVLVLERRDHIGGNMYDFVDRNGILVHKYGPHTFHTDQKNLYDHISKYGQWQDYKLQCMVFMEGKFTPSPFNYQTIDDFYPQEEATQIKAALQECYHGKNKVTIVEMLESKHPTVREYANFLFEKDYSLYTAKQWGISASEIDPGVLKRVPVRLSYDKNNFDDAIQVLPKKGYTEFFQNMLSHSNIEVRLKTDARKHIAVDTDNRRVCFNNKKINVPVIYTGAIDELLNWRFGKLPYRSLYFEYVSKEMESYQNAPIVAYPQAEGYTRITEYNKLPVQEKTGCTTIAVEYPLQYKDGEKMEPYYPIPTTDNIERYQKYKYELQTIQNLFLCGRLAEYKYYNMDQVVARALEVCEELKDFYEQSN